MTKELEEQIGYILYKACANCTDDGLCGGTMELRRRIMDKVSQEKEKMIEKIKSYQGDLILEKTNCAERIDDYLSGHIQACEELINLLKNK